MTSSDALKIWRDANEKFDYYMVAAIGALCAWIVNTIPQQRLNWPLGLQVAGLTLLVVSFWFGLRRIESVIHVHSLSVLMVRTQERLNIKTGEAREASRAGLLAEYDPDTLDDLKNYIFDRAEEIRAEKQRGIARYQWRDWFLIAGFVTYAIGRISMQIGI